MELSTITWNGPPLDDAALLDELPANLAALLRQVNGFLLRRGGLHLRGACLAPTWHSLRDAMHGEQAFHQLYPAVRPSDVPFAQDCMGDQFLLRDGMVFHLLAETGEIESLDAGLATFLAEVDATGENLSMEPLLAWEEQGEQLEPGRLLAAFPPFCSKQSADGVVLASIDAVERRSFLARLAAGLRDVPEGGTFEFFMVE